MIDRRGFLATLAAGAAIGAGGALAGPRVPRVGLVTGGPKSFEAFHNGLREAGYVPGGLILRADRVVE